MPEESRRAKSHATHREFVWPLYIALVLCLIGLSGAKAENFGGWVLEHRGGSFMVTLSFKQSASVNNQLAISELAFICDPKTQINLYRRDAHSF
jgi:hypothetical protein